MKRSISIGAAWRVGAVLERVHSVFRLSGEPRMTRFLAAQLGHSHYFDIRRAQTDLGYTIDLPTAEGMRRLAASWHNEPTAVLPRKRLEL